MPTLATTVTREEPFSYSRPVVPWGADAVVCAYSRPRFQTRARKVSFFT